MKALLATTALAVVVSMGSPASAQVYGQDFQDLHRPGLGAFAQSNPAPMTLQQRRNLARMQSQDGLMHSLNPANDVYDTQGRYISSDPDPFIRNELARVPPDRDDN